MSNDTHYLKKRAITGVRWTSVSLVVNIGMQTLRLLVLARLLPATAFGLIAIVMVFIGFVQIFYDLGLSEAIIQRQKPKKEQLSSLYWTNIATGVFVFFIIYLATPLVADIYDSPEIKQLLPVVALVFLIIPWGTQFGVLLQKNLKFKALALIDISSAAGNTFVAIILALGGFGVWSLVWGQLGGVVIRTALLAVIGFRTNYLPMIHFNRKDLEGYLGFGLHRVGATSLNYFNSRIDQLLIGALLGPMLLGYYSVSFNLVMRPIQRINPVLTKVTFPVFSQIQSNVNQVRKGYFQILRILLSINAPILIGVAVVAPVAVPIILGNKWIPAIPVVQALSFYALLRTIGNAGGGIILARGRADLTFYWNLALFCFIPAVVVIVGLLTRSLVSIAFALVGMQILLVFANYRFLIFKVLGSCLAGYIRSIIQPIGMALFMGIAVYLLRLGVTDILDPWPTLILLVGAGMLIYTIIFWFFNRDDFQEIVGMVTKLRK